MVVMHKGLLRKRILVLAGCASVAITTAAIGVASATVPAGAPNITGVTVTGYPSNPVISVTGTSFGKAPKHGVDPATLPNCSGFTGSLGLDYPGSDIWLLDASRSNGLYGATQWGNVVAGNCGGVTITHWTSTAIQFNLETDVPPSQLQSGDSVCIDIKGVPACLTLP